MVIYMYNTALYIRVSVLEINENNKSQSAENQIKIIKSYLKYKKDFVIYNTYFDIGKSGMSDKREGLKNMLADIYSGNINCVIVKDISRLGRNYTYTGNLIQTVFPFWGVRFISVNDNFDSENNVSNNDYAISLKNILNEGYVRDISKKEKTALRALMKEGKYLGSFAPYGYIKNGKHLETDKEVCENVKHIFAMAKSGISCYKIAKIFNEEKIPTPYEYKIKKGIVNKKENSNFYWSEGTVKRILKNRVYTGDTIQSVITTLSPKGKMVRLPEEKWIVVNNTHEALVNKSDFELIQNMFNNKKQNKNSKKYIEKNKCINVYCGKCGHKMRFKNVKSGSNYRGYYYCSLNLSSGMCRKESVKVDDLKNIVFKIVKICLSQKKSNSSEKAKVYKLNRINKLISSKQSELYEKYKQKKITYNEYVSQKEKLSLKYKKLNKSSDDLNIKSIIYNNFTDAFNYLIDSVTFNENNEFIFKTKFRN